MKTSAKKTLTGTGSSNGGIRIFDITNPFSPQPLGWWADPRIMMAGVVWATFGVYLFRVYRHNVSSRTAAWIAIVGFVFVVILAVIARTLPVGFHVFGL